MSKLIRWTKEGDYQFNGFVGDKHLFSLFDIYSDDEDDDNYRLETLFTAWGNDCYHETLSQAKSHAEQQLAVFMDECGFVIKEGE